MATYTWAGTATSEWTNPANWTVAGAPATTAPNSTTDIAVDNLDNGGEDAIISNGSIITLSTLDIGDPVTLTPGIVGGHVIVGGGPAIGGGGGGTLTAGTIDVTSTNAGGGLVGGPNAVINATALNIGTGAIIGGGGNFDIGTITNAGIIQADGNDYVLGPLVISGNTITGPGSLEVDGSSTLELHSRTAETIAVKVSSGQTASVVFDTAGLPFAGALALDNANANVNLFFQGQAITGATYDGTDLVVTGSSGTIEAIPFTSNGISSFQVDTSTRAGYGEISIRPAPTAQGTLLQNDNGQAAIWQVGGTVIATATAVTPNPGPAWSLVGSGAFVPGDANDLVWQKQDGSVAVWNIGGTSNALTTAAVVANPGSDWQVKGTGDFFGNSDTGILLQNQNGSVVDWDVDTTGTIVGSHVIANPGAAWLVKGTGDFYHNGDTNVLLQKQDGSVAIWDVNTAGTIVSSNVVANPGSDWQVRGTGDFFGNGDSDILFQNQNGSVAIWDIVNGTTIGAAAVVAANPGTAWHIVGTGNFNNDGKTDIAFQKDDGSVAVWDMNGATIAASGLLPNPGTAWHVTGGDSNMRFIQSMAADETLTATTTTPDEFIFTHYAAGAHTIAGFTATQDVVELSKAQFASFAAVQAATTSTSAGAMIDLGNSTSLLLSGVNTSTLHASNFALA